MLLIITPNHVSADIPTNTDVLAFNNSQITNGAFWGKSSAEMAYITFQKPALVAIHAEKMLPPLS